MAEMTITASLDRDLHLRMSYEEYQALEGENIHAEWVDGEAIILMPPGTRHQTVATWLIMLLGNFADLFNLGVVLAAPFEMRLSSDGPAREPDILFVAREHLDRLTELRLVGPADLIIEIVSPESVSRDQRQKFREYEAAGVREYWIVDPRLGRQHFTPFALNAGGAYEPITPDNQGCCHSRVLPGFWLDPTWLWQEPLPAPLPILLRIAPQAVEELLRQVQDRPRD